MVSGWSNGFVHGNPEVIGLILAYATAIGDPLKIIVDLYWIDPSSRHYYW